MRSVESSDFSQQDLALSSNPRPPVVWPASRSKVARTWDGGLVRVLAIQPGPEATEVLSSALLRKMRTLAAETVIPSSSATAGISCSSSSRILMAFRSHKGRLSMASRTVCARSVSSSDCSGSGAEGEALPADRLAVRHRSQSFACHLGFPNGGHVPPAA